MSKLPGMWFGPARTLAVAGVLASTGGAVVGARNLLTGQAEQARSIIPKAWDIPPRADGVYAPGGGPVRRWERGAEVGLHLMVFGDSTAAGYGCRDAEEVPGAVIARGLAELNGLPIRLSTKAIVGATSKGLASQVDAMLVAGPPPDAAVIMIGANDVTTLNGISPSAKRLGAAVGRLQAGGTAVVVGTCPDFGWITAIPQPLRWTARSIGLRLARAQAAETRAAGGVAVPLAALLTTHFMTEPERLFSEDHYHPSADGYALAAGQLLAALCEALGEPMPESSSAADRDAGTEASTIARLNKLLRRRGLRVPAPVVSAAS
jgi:lysophospholipase L1-like esterase